MFGRTALILVTVLVSMPLSDASAQNPPSDAAVGNPIVMVERALELIETGDVSNAQKLLQQAEISKPDLELLLLGKGMLMMASRQDFQAINYLELYNKSKAARSDYRGFAAVGEIYVRNRKYSLAKNVLQRARDLAPIEEDDRAIRSEITTRLAEALVRLDQPRLAIRQLKEAQATSVDDPETQLMICQLAARVNEPVLANEAADNAINGFNQTLRVSPFRRATYEQLTRCFEVLIEMAARDVSRNPDDADAILRTARLMRELGTLRRRVHLIDARDLVLQAIEVGGSSTDKLLLVAEMEAELGGTEQARARIDEILQQDAENARALQLKQSLGELGASSAFGR